MSTSKRIDYVDLFRGVGIILMIMGHIGFGSKFDYFIHAFHMPMFFFISGFFFKKKNVSLKEPCEQQGKNLASSKARTLRAARQEPCEQQGKNLASSKARTLLLPYVVFGAFHEILYSVMQGGIAIPQLKHLVWTNTDGLPIAGALWFLTALYFVDMAYYIIDKRIQSMKTMSLVIALIALLGNTINLFLPFRLPYALDAAFVGLGLYHIGRLFRSYPNQFTERLLNIPLVPNILIGGGTTLLIFWNGYINMRTGTYAIIPLFWLNAVLAILVGLNLSRSINDIIGAKCDIAIRWIKYIGQNSITFLCLNQVVILGCKKIFAELPSMNTLITSLAILVLSVAALMVCDCIIRKTKLRVIIGK